MIYNTGETDEKLKVEYNPEGSVLRKVQLRLLDMLVYLDKVCKEQHIEYCLDSGNVLGAVRHGGFIPWDDDVDVIVRMGDYKKLCDYLLKHPHPQYVLQTPDTDPYFIDHWNVLRDIKSEYIQNSKRHNLRKFRGMQIDIFPVETNVIPFLFRCICYFHGQVTNQVLFKWKKGGVVLFKLEKYIIIPLVRLLSRAMGRKNKNRYSYAYGLTWLKFFDGNVIYPTSDIIFEKHVFQGPNNPEEYLKIQYGNYMDLPPEEIRVGHKAQYVVFD